MAELIFEKAKALSAGQQREALSFVDYLSRRSNAQAEAEAWKVLMEATRTVVDEQAITPDLICSEIRACRQDP